LAGHPVGTRPSPGPGRHEAADPRLVAGEWFGIAPSNTAFRMPIHEFHAIEDGKITHTWHLEDWFGWLNQVGAWPQKETA